MPTATHTHAHTLIIFKEHAIRSWMLKYLPQQHLSTRKCKKKQTKKQTKKKNTKTCMVPVGEKCQLTRSSESTSEHRHAGIQMANWSFCGLRKHFSLSTANNCSVNTHTHTQPLFVANNCSGSSSSTIPVSKTHSNNSPFHHHFLHHHLHPSVAIIRFII